MSKRRETPAPRPDAGPNRRFPVGAEPGAGGVRFRVWAPKRQTVEVVLDGAVAPVALTAERDGYFSALVPGAAAGAKYRYRLDGADSFPDPASRYQPEGPHGPSQVIDPADFRWTDDGWAGVSIEGQIIYELHVGAFTREGTWKAAARELPELASLGITTIEIMPIADFPGRFGWGYDGVNLFAPVRLYGAPDDFRGFVNAAHAAGIAVILDVVYNHFGPDGNYLRQYSDHYFTDRHVTDWGEAINFQGPEAIPVREFYLANARYWIEEFHLDGLRLDATQDIKDDSPEHIIAAIARTVRAAGAPRATILIAENEPQHARLARPVADGGYGLDALWNDDFHHSAMVALVGRDEAYYTDYRGSPQEFVSAAKWGYLYQGQWYAWQRQRRGTAGLDLRPAQFVTFIQNHDQVANSARGERVHELSSPGRHRAMTALMLLGPGTPMLFMGQEFAASHRFPYFADHVPDLADLVRLGRLEFLGQFPSLALPEMQTGVPDPSSPSTFEDAKLDFSERERNAEQYALHRDLIALRRSELAFRLQRPRGVDGAVLSANAFLLRFFAENNQDRLLLVNFGRTLHLDPAPEPLLAPLEYNGWSIRWSSEDPRYGGAGTPALETPDNWRIPAEAAVVLAPAP